MSLMLILSLACAGGPQGPGAEPFGADTSTMPIGDWVDAQAQLGCAGCPDPAACSLAVASVLSSCGDWIYQSHPEEAAECLEVIPADACWATSLAERPAPCVEACGV